MNLWQIQDCETRIFIVTLKCKIVVGWMKYFNYISTFFFCRIGVIFLVFLGRSFLLDPFVYAPTFVDKKKDHFLLFKSYYFLETCGCEENDKNRNSILLTVCGWFFPQLVATNFCQCDPSNWKSLTNRYAYYMWLESSTKLYVSVSKFVPVGKKTNLLT